MLGKFIPTDCLKELLKSKQTIYLMNPMKILMKEIGKKKIYKTKEHSYRI